MTQYINKATVVEEIQKVYDNDYKFLPSDIVESVQNFKDDLLMNLDTLEVKEVDLEKELENWLGERVGKWTGKECERMCRYFFELGLEA